VRLQTQSFKQSYSARLSRSAALLVGIVIISGCAQTGRWTRADYELGHELPLAAPSSLDTPIRASDLTDISAKIFLLSDNQRHELLGGRVDWFRNAASDKFVAPVAIRPPQLDMFGQDLLTEALAMTDGFVLHLGDACDLSNTAEFGRFAWDMQGAPHGWVMAPGNHDGYFYGNSSRTFDYLVREWNNTGESYTMDGTKIISRAMQKDRYVSYYLAALILQDAAWSGPLAQQLGSAVLQQFEQWKLRDRDTTTFTDYWPELVTIQEEIYQFTDSHGDDDYHGFELPAGLAPAGEPHLRRLAWHIDKERAWRSFVLQEVDISGPNHLPPEGQDGVSILVLDTAQYSIQPMMEFGLPSSILHKVTGGYIDTQIAGETGGIHDTQVAAAAEFATSMGERQRQWMLASHHPFESLGRDAKKRFNRLRDQGGIPVTLSAHTHAGGIRWNHDGAREGDWLEINVGSVLDAPIEFRDLQVHLAGDRPVISSHRQPLENLLRERGLVFDELPGYRPNPEDADFYLSYRKGSTDLASDVNFQVKRILLATYLRMFNLFPSDLPGEGSTIWPTGPDGIKLDSHQMVTDTQQDMLARVSKDDVEDLTQFLYELREYDRTRQLTDATREQLRVYRLSQAIWAGHAEHKPADKDDETMDADFSYFVLPSAN
jgi:hypothetical protein